MLQAFYVDGGQADTEYALPKKILGLRTAQRVGWSGVAVEMSNLTLESSYLDEDVEDGEIALKSSGDYVKIGSDFWGHLVLLLIDGIEAGEVQGYGDGT